MSNMEGKVALVTGAARRIGAAVAEALHGTGMNVVVHYRTSADAAEALARELNARRPDSASLCPADLLDPAAPDALVAACLSRFGRLDLLVNNASTFYPTAVGTIGASAWDDLVGTNLKAPLFLSQSATPALREQRGGIINIVDIHGLRPLAGHTVYCVAKAGLVMLTRALALELAPEVRVNAIAPGLILWPESGDEPFDPQSVLDTVPLARQGHTEDIASAVIFLARDAAYTSGHVLTVDGGRNL